MKNNILLPEGTTSRKILISLNEIFKNQCLRGTPTKPPTPTNVLRVIFQSNDTTRVPRVQLHSNDAIIVPKVQPPAVTPSPQPTLLQSTRICNLPKPIVDYNTNGNIHLSALEEHFISDMTNINSVIDPTTGYIL